MSTNYDHEYDVIVVGSGNGALTSAICSHDGGAKVLVIEKSNQFGGTSACLLYTSPSPRDRTRSRMPSSA